MRAARYVEKRDEGPEGGVKEQLSLRRMQLEREGPVVSGRLGVCRNARSSIGWACWGPEAWRSTRALLQIWLLLPILTTHRSWGEKEVSETYTALEGGSNIWRVLCGRVVPSCIFSWGWCIRGKVDGLGASEGGCKAALGAVPVEKVPEEDCWAVPVVADADDRPAVSCDAMSVKCNASQWRVYL